MWCFGVELPAAHVDPDNLWKVRMLYDAQSDKNEYDRLSEKDKDVVDTWHEIQNSQIIPVGTILSRGCDSGQFGPVGWWWFWGTRKFRKLGKGKLIRCLA